MMSLGHKTYLAEQYMKSAKRDHIDSKHTRSHFLWIIIKYLNDVIGMTMQSIETQLQLITVHKYAQTI